MKIGDSLLFYKNPPILTTPPFFSGKSDPPPPPALFFENLENSNPKLWYHKLNTMFWFTDKSCDPKR